MSIHRHIDEIQIRPLTVMAEAITIVEAIGEHILDQHSGQKNQRDYMTFLHMTMYIENHYAEKLKMEDIAHSGLVSRAKAYRLFEQYVRITPNQYLLRYRITKSSELLLDTTLSITDISELCGFSSPGYFTSMFRREKGMSPREYRMAMS